MIARLNGRIAEKQPHRVTVDVHGVGYDLHIPLSTFYGLGDPGSEAAFRVHTHVREDTLALFGFATALELRVFEQLIGISGIGPRLALAVLSGIEPAELVRAVGRGDVRRLTGIPGIGKKTAERMGLELRDRLPAVAEAGSEPEAGAGLAAARGDLVVGAREPRVRPVVGGAGRRCRPRRRGRLVRAGAQAGPEGDRPMTGDDSPPRVVSSARLGDDDQFEAGLRPRSLEAYIGQERLRENLGIAIAAARQRGEALDHVLLYGPPGLGKTTLAHVIGHELGVAVRTTAGPVLEKAGDLAGILTNLAQHEVLFIDEIHRMSPVVEEILYPAMEDYELDIVIGQGPGARSVKVPLKPFTLIGATTRAGLLTSPLRARFGLVHRLDFYRDEDLQEIIRRSAGIFDVPIEDGAAAEIAGRSRGTPRVANRLLRRVRDFAQVRADGRITRRPRRAENARCRHQRLRRGRPPAAPRHHRQVRGRSGGAEQHRGRDQRGKRGHRGHLRAVPDSDRVPRPDAARAGGDRPRLRLLRGPVAEPRRAAVVETTPGNLRAPRREPVAGPRVASIAAEPLPPAPGRETR